MNKIKSAKMGKWFCLATAVFLFCYEIPDWLYENDGKHFNPNINYTSFTDSRDNQSYKSVAIGTQTWMAENLNYNASGSKCYDNNSANCNKYGRLYNWSTAMGDANSSGTIPSGVQGVCPVGWHLPSDAEWQILVDYAGSNNITGGGSDIAGTKLKSSTGWNGTDDFGFSALPGGLGNSSGFHYAGRYGNWWSATENDALNASYAWHWFMYYNSEDAYRSSGVLKSVLYSIRCVQDDEGYTVAFNSQGGSVVDSQKNVAHGSKVIKPTDPTRGGYTFGGWYREDTCTTPWDFDTDTVMSFITLYATWTLNNYTVTFNSQGGSVVDSQKNIVHGSKVIKPTDPTRGDYTFGGWYMEATCTTPWDFAVDTVTSVITLYAKWGYEDNYTYTGGVVTIGTQKWMAKNLDRATANSKCYNNSPDSCAKYGMLYTWNDAMGGANSSNTVPSGVRGVCPTGWHLPSDDEWNRLGVAVGGLGIAGTKLKSTTGWKNYNGNSGNGTDDFGFSALPGGSGGSDGYYSVGDYGFWWSATERNAGYAWRKEMGFYNENMYGDSNSKAALLSVRCVAD